MRTLAAYKPERLTGRHTVLIDTFICTSNTTNDEIRTEVQTYLRTLATREENENVSRTFVFVAEEPREIGGFITISAASIESTDELKAALGSEKDHIPAVMIDYMGVADEVRHEDLPFGREMFEW